MFDFFYIIILLIGRIIVCFYLILEVCRWEVERLLNLFFEDCSIYIGKIGVGECIGLRISYLDNK